MVVDGIAEGDGDEEDKAVVAVETEVVVDDAVADDETVEDVHSNVVD